MEDKANMTRDNCQQSGQLAVVSTPIGNLGDLSQRAIETIQKADILACEDTRMTRKLLSLCGIKTAAKLLPYHDHNGPTMRPKLLAELTAGRSVALVSDAGTPLISDPGFKLVAACHAAGVPVTAIPGASAVLAGLAIAGLPSDRFLFAGFIPASTSAATTAFTEIARLTATSIWFESPKRLAANLTLMLAIFGDRQAVITRELTKLHEECHRGTLADLASHYAAAPTPKGEIVVLIAGADVKETQFDTQKLTFMLREEMRVSSLRDAVKTVAEISERPRKLIYSLAIDLDKNEGEDKDELAPRFK